MLNVLGLAVRPEEPSHLTRTREVPTLILRRVGGRDGYQPKGGEGFKRGALAAHRVDNQSRFR